MVVLYRKDWLIAMQLFLLKINEQLNYNKNNTWSLSHVSAYK